jgi:catecholate siderophore receptor
MSKTTLYSATALLLALSPSAFAQTSSDEDIIIVEGRALYSDQINALKTPTPIIDVPQSLSIVTADDIAERGYSSIGQIIDYTPGVNNSQGEGHRDAVVFRGVRSTADFYLDGVRDDVQYYRSLYNLEQVEILRGPNALLFGRGGTGGLLNRVTKKATIGETFTGYRGSVNTFGGFDVAVDSNFDVSDAIGFRVNAYYESLNNHRDFFDGDRFGINPTARFELTPSTMLDVSYEYNNNERFIDRGIPSAAPDGTTSAAANTGLRTPVEALDGITFGDEALNTAEFVTA